MRRWDPQRGDEVACLVLAVVVPIALVIWLIWIFG